MTSVHSNCLICNSQNIEKLERYRINYLAKCRSCGFVFCEKIPAENELLSYYTNYPRNNFNSEITVKRYNELLDEFEKYRNTENILDIGSGDGYFLNEAQKRGWNVFGTEYTNTAISICSDKGITMHKGKLSPENYREYFLILLLHLK